MMRKNIVWWIYIIYFMIIGLNTFATNSLQADRSLASWGFKSPYGESRYGYGGTRLYNEYKPNVGGFLMWAGSGAMIAYMLQGDGNKKRKENKAGE
jgi:hypothetical protein